MRRDCYWYNAAHEAWKDEKTFKKRDTVARSNKAEILYEHHLSTAVWLVCSKAWKCGTDAFRAVLCRQHLTMSYLVTSPWPLLIHRPTTGPSHQAQMQMNWGSSTTLFSKHKRRRVTHTQSGPGAGVRSFHSSKGPQERTGLHARSYCWTICRISLQSCPAGSLGIAYCLEASSFTLILKALGAPYCVHSTPVVVGIPIPV